MWYTGLYVHVLAMFSFQLLGDSYLAENTCRRDIMHYNLLNTETEYPVWRLTLQDYQ